MCDCVCVCVCVCMHVCVCCSGGGDGESGGEMKSHQGQSTSQLINNFSKWQGKKNYYKHGTEIYGGIYTESC